MTGSSRSGRPPVHFTRVSTGPSHRRPERSRLGEDQGVHPSDGSSGRRGYCRMVRRSGRPCPLDSGGTRVLYTTRVSPQSGSSRRRFPGRGYSQTRPGYLGSEFAWHNTLPPPSDTEDPRGRTRVRSTGCWTAGRCPDCTHRKTSRSHPSSGTPHGRRSTYTRCASGVSYRDAYLVTGSRGPHLVSSTRGPSLRRGGGSVGPVHGVHPRLRKDSNRRRAPVPLSQERREDHL